MVGEDTVTMSAKELRRVHVMRQVREKRITQREAGAMLQLTDRQIRRLVSGFCGFHSQTQKNACNCR